MKPNCKYGRSSALVCDIRKFYLRTLMCNTQGRLVTSIWLIVLVLIRAYSRYIALHFPCLDYIVSFETRDSLFFSNGHVKILM